MSRRIDQLHSQIDTFKKFLKPVDKYDMRPNSFYYILIYSILFSSSSLFAQNGVPKSLNVQGTIYQPASNNPFIGTANIRFQILNPAGNCVMYQETVTGVDTTNTNGAFSVDLGTTATRINNIDSTTSLGINLFRNNVTHPSITGCAGPVVIGANETRKLRISFDVGSGYSDMTPDIEILTAPYAMIAETLDGYAANEFIMANTSAGLQVSQVNLETLLNNLTKFNTLNNFATSGNITGNAATATTASSVSDGAITAAKLAQMAATNGQVMKWNGSAWVASADSTGASPSGGTASAPGYAFSGDANTGVFSSTADTMGFSTAGTEAMTILANSNVGIGNPSPGSKLTVTGNMSLTNAVVGNVAVSVQGASGQTANLQEWKNFAGSVLAYISSAGNFVISTGNLIISSQNATDGAACTTVGSISRDSNGDLFLCK